MRIKNILIPFLLSLTVTFLLVALAYRFSDRPAVVPYEKPQSPAAGGVDGGQAAAPPTPRVPDSLKPSPAAGAGLKQGPGLATEGKKERPISDEEAHRLMARAAMNDQRLVQTLAGEVREGDSPVLAALVRDGRMSPEDARKLKSWSASRRAGGAEAEQPRAEMVGSTMQGDAPVRRYRLTDGEGSLLMLEMRRRADGSWDVAGVVDQSAGAAGEPAPDPLALADAFVQSARRGDVAAARRLVAGSGVDAATLAGVCMIFDEDIYSLRDREPIRGMFQNEKKAGFLVYLRSKSDGKTAHIGLEMARDARGEWKISAVSLDSLLQEYEQSGGLEGGRYFPIVRKPKGGESVALFFGFNDDALTPRSLRQLAIVAELMKGTNRRLDISGHTDDIGSQRFNYALSLRRAQAVQQALVRAGVDPSRLRVHGFGKLQPLRRIGAGSAPEQVEEARGENRRAEIYLDFSE